jgi:hypothetical protein
MKYLIAIWAITAASLSYAACTTHTYQQNGRFITCTTCCDYAGNCNTNCY